MSEEIRFALEKLENAVYKLKEAFRLGWIQ